jgi:hypothetical protein
LAAALAPAGAAATSPRRFSPVAVAWRRPGRGLFPAYHERLGRRLFLVWRASSDAQRGEKGKQKVSKQLFRAHAIGSPRSP